MNRKKVRQKGEARRSAAIGGNTLTLYSLLFPVLYSISSRDQRWDQDKGYFRAAGTVLKRVADMVDGDDERKKRNPAALWKHESYHRY